MSLMLIPIIDFLMLNIFIEKKKKKKKKKKQNIQLKDCQRQVELLFFSQENSTRIELFFLKY